jgi:hypothetical protein
VASDVRVIDDMQCLGLSRFLGAIVPRPFGFGLLPEPSPRSPWGARRRFVGWVGARCRACPMWRAATPSREWWRPLWLGSMEDRWLMARDQGRLDIPVAVSRIATQNTHRSLVMARSMSGGQLMHMPMMALVGTVFRV